MNRSKSKFIQSAFLFALLALFLPACSSLANEEPAAELENAYSIIDVEKLTAPQGDSMDHYVAPVDEELFIGIAVAGQGAGGEERTVIVYLCDSREVSQWISGEISGQEGTLQAGDSSAEVTITDNEVSGMVALDGGEPQPFSAEAAADDAGVYLAELSQGGLDSRLGWVILNDGRQRGPLDGKGNDVVVVDPN